MYHIRLNSRICHNLTYFFIRPFCIALYAKLLNEFSFLDCFLFNYSIKSDDNGFINVTYVQTV